MTREELELLTDVRDFTTLFGVILRCESSESVIKTENILDSSIKPLCFMLHTV